jgi:4-amino-4-deoxy-L-arabinose transferase-like glycosyltransferase
MNAFEALVWIACAYVLIRIIKTTNQKLWIWFGLLAGIGLENKRSMLIWGTAITAGLLLTRQRQWFRTPWIWIAGLLAFLIFLPNLVWNYQHHFPFLELQANIRHSGRNVELTPLSFFSQEVDDRQDRLEDLFASVTRVANVYHPYSMPSEHFEVFYCRGLKWPLNEMWPKLKSWD